MSSQGSSRPSKTSRHNGTGTAGLTADANAATTTSQGKNNLAERLHVSSDAAEGAQSGTPTPGNLDQNTEHVSDATTGYTSASRVHASKNATGFTPRGPSDAPDGTGGGAATGGGQREHVNDLRTTDSTSDQNAAFKSVFKKFDTRVAKIFAEFDSVAQSIEGFRKRIQEREDQKAAEMLSSLLEQKDVMREVVEGTRAELGQVAKGKFVPLNVPETGAASSASTARPSESRHEDPTAPLTRARPRKVTIEDVTDDEADAGPPPQLRRDAPPHMYGQPSM
ncbi:hypothetical protein PsYK624_110520 [Phanerochaete sordida]|uniref:Uncharacterized protein n=1 Tax=Phanerochaete sordida TaxID=48140 RepID=A0A9P3GHG9_9APHY|nr:hypothetical protein PsYK624_110520 [Phanerochaete sordida]